MGLHTNCESNQSWGYPVKYASVGLLDYQYLISVGSGAIWVHVIANSLDSFGNWCESKQDYICTTIILRTGQYLGKRFDCDCGVLLFRRVQVV